MVITIRSKPGFGADRFFGATARSKLSKAQSNLPIKPPPKVDSKLKPVSLRTVKTTALATAPPVRGWRNGETRLRAVAHHEAGHAVAACWRSAGPAGCRARRRHCRSAMRDRRERQRHTAARTSTVRHGPSTSSCRATGH